MSVTFNKDCFELTFNFLYENKTSMCFHKHRSSKYRLDIFSVLKIDSMLTDKNKIPYFKTKVQH